LPGNLTVALIIVCMLLHLFGRLEVVLSFPFERLLLIGASSKQALDPGIRQKLSNIHHIRQPSIFGMFNPQT